MKNPVNLALHREEATVIPLGVSYTETEAAWYVRIRPEDGVIITIRVAKKGYKHSFRVETDD